MQTPVSTPLKTTAKTASHRTLMTVYTATIFLSAGLLFMIQPLFARLALPLLGGAPAVWNTAMVFYQAVLLLGYAYSHYATRLLGVRRQSALHLLVVLAPLLVLPIGIPKGWTPPVTENAVPWLLLLLAATVGLPFFAISTSSPLLQRWFSQTGHPHAHDPYFLYAASNMGSMIGLFSYPLLMEPALRLSEQSWLWTGGYLLFVLLIASCVVLLRRRVPADNPETAPAESAAESAADAPLPARRILRWVLLASLPSSLMLGITTYIATELGPLPLLWSVPLGLYLLTYILVFASKPPLSHALMRRLFPFILLPVVALAASNTRTPFLPVMFLHLLAFFITTMVCHGELAADRPAPRQLTSFFMWMSVGGVLGGLFNAIVAPLLFKSVYEYPIALVLAALIVPRAVSSIQRPRLRRQAQLLDLLIPAALLIGIYLLGALSGRLGLSPAMAIVLGFGLPAALCYAFLRRPLRFGLSVGALFVAGGLFVGGPGILVHAERSFFGIHRVLEMPIEGRRVHGLVHGNTLHGAQSQVPGEEREQLLYYAPGTPASQIFAAFGPQRSQQPVAVVGLGAGSMVCYSTPGQEWVYYEIDPAVERIARDPRYFSFLSTCAPQASITLGDARLTMGNAPAQHYGAIFLDAYTSDSLPLHLLTHEALELYLSKLEQHGLLAFHITNRHFDLEPILGALAQDLGLTARIREMPMHSQSELGKSGTLRWVAMTRTAQDLGPLLDNAEWRPLNVPEGTPVWTDEFNSLISVITSIK